VPLERATAIVLSHGHYDHTGGLAAALERAADARVYVHPDAQLLRYSRRPGVPPRSIGMSPADGEALARASGRITWTERPLRLTDRIGITGPIPRRTPGEDPGSPYYLDIVDTTPDPFTDDQALWIRTDQGPIVVAGCAHAGAVNTMEAVVGLSGSETIHALIGGLHLLHADASRLQVTADAFARRRIRRLAPCHCTGEEAIAFLQARFPDALEPCCAGARFTL
jgi:7,8-dihydropterin-6-yl-methyl-4-(beta-D-ribofuranosyl)aminobenzene 5'-phosphate synthase